MEGEGKGGQKVGGSGERAGGGGDRPALSNACGSAEAGLKEGGEALAFACGEAAGTRLVTTLLANGATLRLVLPRKAHIVLRRLVRGRARVLALGKARRLEREVCASRAHPERKGRMGGGMSGWGEERGGGGEGEAEEGQNRGGSTWAGDCRHHRAASLTLLTHVGSRGPRIHVSRGMRAAYRGWTSGCPSALVAWPWQWACSAC